VSDDEPPAVGIDLVEKRQKVSLGVFSKNGRLVAFVRSSRKKGKGWLQEGQVEVSPNLPAIAQTIFEQAARMWFAKKAEVQQVLRAQDKPKKRKRKKWKSAKS